MRYSYFNDLGFKISNLGLGTEIFSRKGKKITLSNIEKIFKVAFDQGINFLDTAECYGNHKSEKIIGDLIDNRDKWIIASKFGHEFYKEKQIDCFNLNSVKKQLDKSLKNLKTDYIDIYYFHSGTDKEFFNDDLWNYLNKQVKIGKIKYLGLSLKHELVISNKLKQINHLKDYNIKFLQTVYNYLSQESAINVFDVCIQDKIKIVGRMPLAKGLLSGKYRSDLDFEINDPRLKFKSFNCEFYKKLKSELNHIPKKNLPQWSIAWVLSNKNISSSIVGCNDVRQLKQIIDSINYIPNINKIY